MFIEVCETPAATSCAMVEYHAGQFLPDIGSQLPALMGAILALFALAFIGRFTARVMFARA